VADSLTVIVPSYNRRGSLLRLLESLVVQHRAGAAFDVVVSLDGSTDGSAEAVRGATWPFPVQVVERPNGGPAAARNAGAAAATGDILLFIDDDVELAPEAVRAHLDEHARYPGAAVIGSITTRGRRGFPSWVGPNYRRATSVARENGGWLSQRYLMTGIFSIPRALFLEHRFREDLRRLEDAELGYRLGLAGVPLRMAFEGGIVHLSSKGTADILADISANSATVARSYRTDPELGRFLSPRRVKQRPAWAVAPAMVASRVPFPRAVAAAIGALPVSLPGAGIVFRVLRQHAYLRGIGREVRGLPAWRAYLNREGEGPP
jgi:glycosyltransferase involved in cell wall biosynthesis